MTYRALELLNLPPEEPAFLLDIGCGSGLSGEILDEEGYIWTGVDIAPSMLGDWRALLKTRLSYFLPEVALEREVQGDLFLQDIGQGFGFRPGSFDAAIRYAIIAHSVLKLTPLFQYIGTPMATQCRDIASNVLSSTSLNTFFHHSSFCLAQSISRRIPILPVI